MATGSGDFELTMDELRAVARFAVESAQEVLPIFERADGEDLRPRAAIEAAWAFVNGAARSNVQRLTSLDAHRAAKRVVGEPAHFAARSAGDAAAAAYLHPIAKATQVGHILRPPGPARPRSAPRSATAPRSARSISARRTALTGTPRGARDRLGHHAGQRALAQVAEEQPHEELLLGLRRAREELAQRRPPHGLGARAGRRPDAARTPRRPRSKSATARRPRAAGRAATPSRRRSGAGAARPTGRRRRSRPPRAPSGPARRPAWRSSRAARRWRRPQPRSRRGRAGAPRHPTTRDPQFNRT